MAEKKSRVEAWQDNYDALCAYVKEHHQFPDKKKEESRGLLNWWKYNKKRMKHILSFELGILNFELFSASPAILNCSVLIL